MRFRKNDTITLNETETIVVKDFLGDGGQGEVYLVEKIVLILMMKNILETMLVC